MSNILKNKTPNRSITLPTGTKYLSQHLTNLPSNCIFDKGKVGCGGTTLAIKSNKPYVIAMPFVSLIENKANQHSEVLPVYKGVTVNQITKYVNNSDCPVILTTYDSLDKVMSAINVEDFTLLVDEYHLLFTQYSFRESAIHNVLDNYTKFKDFCFMTATVLDEEFILDELRQVPIVKAIWDNVAEVKVSSILCPRGVLGSTIDLIRNHLTETVDGNAYIFVNSVTFIKEILSNVPELNRSNCNVVYSTNNKTKLGIKRGTLPSTLEQKQECRKINLLTSTVFEGSDIYDRDGKTYIISDSSKAHTLVDISTSFQQIAGRIRNSKYITEITHLFTKTRYNNLTYTQFKLRSQNDIRLTKIAVTEFNSLSDYTKKLFQSKPNETYLSEVDGKFVFNANLVKLDLYNFKICKHIYSLRVNVMEEELSKYNYNVHSSTDVSSTTLISTEDLDGFEITVKTLKKILESRIQTEEDLAFIESTYKKYTFLEKTILKMGFTGIEEEKYIQTNIKRKLVGMLDINQETKVFKLIKSYSNMNAGDFVPSTTLKNRFTEIYKQLGMPKKANGSDITSFFTCESKVKRIKGKLVKGYVIYTPKYMIKDNG